MKKFFYSQFTMIKLSIVAVLLMSFIASTIQAQEKEGNQYKVRVDIPGIPGEGIGGAIETFGFDQLVTQTVSNEPGGPGAGRVRFDPVVITKAIDSATPKLLDLCANGRHLRSVLISWTRSSHLTKSGEIVYYRVLLEDVLVSSVRSRLPNQNDPKLAQLGPVEDVGFSFSRITWSYILPNGTTITEGHDLKSNKSL